MSKPLLTSLPNDDNEENEGIEDNEDAVEVWIIGWTRRDRKICVNDDQIVLSSLCEPTLEFTFTPYRWIQFVASIQLIADIIRLSPSERKAMEMLRHGLFRRHLGNGYFIVVMYHLARSANLPEGLYILPMFFLYFFIFLNFFSGRPRSHAGSEANGPIFTKISGLVDN